MKHSLFKILQILLIVIFLDILILLFTYISTLFIKNDDIIEKLKQIYTLNNIKFTEKFQKTVAKISISNNYKILVYTVKVFMTKLVVCVLLLLIRSENRILSENYGLNKKFKALIVFIKIFVVPEIINIIYNFNHETLKILVFLYVPVIEIIFISVIYYILTSLRQQNRNTKREEYLLVILYLSGRVLVYILFFLFNTTSTNKNSYIRYTFPYRGHIYKIFKKYNREENVYYNDTQNYHTDIVNFKYIIFVANKNNNEGNLENILASNTRKNLIDCVLLQQLSHVLNNDIVRIYLIEFFILMFKHSFIVYFFMSQIDFYVFLYILFAFLYTINTVETYFISIYKYYSKIRADNFVMENYNKEHFIKILFKISLYYKKYDLDIIYSFFINIFILNDPNTSIYTRIMNLMNIKN